MKRYTFGTPEKGVPSDYCKGFSYTETDISIKQNDFTFRTTDKGCILEFPIAPDTHIYGFGLQFYRFNHYGHKLTIRCNADAPRPSGDSHAPVPFFVTDKGYGMYFDTARYAEFYCGVLKPTDAYSDQKQEVKLSEEELYAARKYDSCTILSVYIPVAKGIDVYVMEGKNITDITSQYNMLSGGGFTADEWALGLLYRCNGSYNDRQILDIAKYFRENDLPCSILGIEPGWHTHAYSCTYVWNKERFPDPEGFVNTLRDMNYHVNLWEHAYIHPDSPLRGPMLPYSGDYCVWGGLVPDFSIPEARKTFADYHRNYLVDMGVDGFKADECDGSDFTGGWAFPNHSQFPSGLDGERYHNLFGTLYAKAMGEALEGKNSMNEIRSLGALSAPYPFVIYSDLSQLKSYLTGLVNSGFSGIIWAPEVRCGGTKKELMRRMQLVCFSVQCLVNAWNQPEIPWLKYDCVDEIRDLLNVRYSLIPEIQKALKKYKEEGVPPVRALVMDFTDDPNVKEIDDEYMFCGNMLVAPILDDTSDTRTVYLPEGEWVDFHTGEKVGSGKFEVTTENIPVFRKIN